MGATSEEILAHGTRLGWTGGRLVRMVGRAGDHQATLTWAGDRLASLTVAGYRAALVVDGARADHPLLGPVHALTTVDGTALAAMSALDWARPAAIPAIDRPGALPAGTGTLLLAVIARLALAAGVTALRYAGPYPTDALWASLAQAFRASGHAADFTAAAATRWTGADRSPIAIDFAPAPFERLACAPGVFVQLRDGLERAVVDGAVYQPGAGVRRLIATDGGGAEAALWFGDRRHATVATFAADGALRERAPLPPVTGAPCGQRLPPPLVEALAALVADLVPAPLAEAAAAALGATAIEWGDAGAAAAIDRGDLIVLHAALWWTLAPAGLARVAAALAEALAPIAAARAVAALSAAAASPSR